MFFINWILCIGAIYVLWKKAPFTPIQKALITFSTPFLFYFGPVARCYSVGLLLLFLICSYHKERFKKPLFFASLIALAANTNILMAIGVFYIGLIFFYEILERLKNNDFLKKDFWGVFSIFAFCALILILQFIGVRNIEGEENSLHWSVIANFAILPKANKLFPFILRIVSCVAFYYFAYLSFKNAKKGFLFISGTYLTLTYLFLNFYNGSHWNHYFYVIYFIVLFWIYYQELVCNKFAKTLLVCVLTLFIFPKAVLETGKMDLIYSSKCKEVTKEILNIPNVQNAKIFSFEWWGDVIPGSSAYLAQNNVVLYDIHDRERRSFESYKNIFYMKNEVIDAITLFEKYEHQDTYVVTMGPLREQKFADLFVIPTEKDFIFKRGEKEYLLKLINPKEKMAVAIFKVIKL